MKKYWYKAAMLTMALGVFTACDDEDTPKVPEGPVAPTNGAYIINTGNWNENNGTIQWYDRDQKSVSTDLFAAANGEGIGDAQDLCVYGSKVYITCSTSAKIEIVNRADFKRIQTINLAEGGQAVSPRYMAAHGGNIYFTAQDGTLSRLDTTSLAVTGKIEVGQYPEALTVAGGKLYVNLSDFVADGTGKYVAVVDIATFQKKKEIEVLLNPYSTSFTGEDGKVYFISSGDYGVTTPSTLQCIDPATDQVTDVCPASAAAMLGNKIYLIYADYYVAADAKHISVYNTDTKETTSFAGYSSFKNPGSIVADPATGDVIIIDQPYSELNDIYVYSSDGNLKKKIETGVYTTNMRFVD